MWVEEGEKAGEEDFLEGGKEDHVGRKGRGGAPLRGEMEGMGVVMVGGVAVGEDLGMGCKTQSCVYLGVGCCR